MLNRTVASSAAKLVRFQRCSVRGIPYAFVRHYSEERAPDQTTKTPEQPKKAAQHSFKREPVTSFAEAQRKNLSVVSQANILVKDPEMDATSILTNLEAILSTLKADAEDPAKAQYASSAEERMLRSSISMGHRYLTRLHELNAATGNDQVPDSLLFSRLVSIFSRYGMLHISHLNRVLETMLSEGSFSKALSTWIESLEFFKAHPDRMIDDRERKNRRRPMLVSKDTFFYGGLAAYLLSLTENSAKLDPEFVKLILADYGARPTTRKFAWYLGSTRLQTAQRRTATAALNRYLDDTVDFNSARAWRAALKAAEDDKGAKMERMVTDNIARAHRKGQKLTEDTWGKIMQIYNVGGNYQAALKTWAEASATMKPSVSMWNQLLIANARSNAPKRLLRVESVWKLLQGSVEPDAESYRALVKGYVLCGELSKAMEIVGELKEKKPELVDDLLKEDLVVGLLENGHGKEADELFRAYMRENEQAKEVKQKKVKEEVKEEAKAKEAKEVKEDKAKESKAEVKESKTEVKDSKTEVKENKAEVKENKAVAKEQKASAPNSSLFHPSIRLYNKLLHFFLKTNNLKRATQIIDSLIQEGKSNRRLAPDVATWTTVVDIVLKESRQMGASPDFIVNELQNILTSMKTSGVRMNEEALTMLISNLTRNPETAELGWQFFEFMRQNKMRISAVAYTSIIFSECVNGRMDRALELFQQGLTSGIKLRPQYYNLIFKGYSDHPNVDSTIKFFRFIDGKTAGKSDMRPNFFTFYYMLREALYVGDEEFTSFVVSKLHDENLHSFGRIDPLLDEIQSNGIEIPSDLKQKAHKSFLQYENM